MCHFYETDSDYKEIEVFFNNYESVGYTLNFTEKFWVSEVSVKK